MVENAITTHRSKPANAVIKSFKRYHGKEFLKLRRERDDLANRTDREARLRRREIEIEMREMRERYDAQLERWAE